MKSNARGTVRNHTYNSLDSRRGSRRSSFIARALLVLMFFSMLLPTPDSIIPNHVMAADGDLVPSFGTNGFVTTDFFGRHESANAVTTGITGKIIAAGFAATSDRGTDMAIACYDSDGDLDPAFGEGGKATVDFFGADDAAIGVAVQPDGKIVVSGVATNGAERQFALARYLTDGNLDPTFGQGGKVVLDLGSTSEAFKVALQPDGKIVAVGDSRPQASLEMTVVRLNPADGSRDASFGNNGVVTIDFGNADRAIDLAIDEQNIFVCGFVAKTQTDSDFGVARLNTSNGSLDNAFDGDGKVTTDFSGKQDGAQAIRISDERIIVAGFATNETSDFAFARYNRNGSLDTSFDGDGKQTIDFSGGRDLAFGLFEQPDRDIVAAGWAGIGDEFILGLARFKAEDGRLDTGFGLGGKSMFDINRKGNNVAYDAILYKDTIITAGAARSPDTKTDWAITQHKNKKFFEFTKKASPNPAGRGDIITYTFGIKNLTNREIPVRVKDFLPEGGALTFDQVSNPNWQPISDLGRVLVSETVKVPGGGTREISLRLRADRGGPIKNEANLIGVDGIDGSSIKVDKWLLAQAEVEVKDPASPTITAVTREGQDLKVSLTGFGASSGANEPSAIEPQANCPVVLIDGQEQKTKLDPVNPSTVLIVKKGYKRLAPGQTVRIRVRLCGGTETADFIYTRPQ